jgi:transposase
LPFVKSQDLTSFARPGQSVTYVPGSYLPREHTTGESHKLGGITKAGNAHARWILTEAGRQSQTTKPDPIFSLTLSSALYLQP